MLRLLGYVALLVLILMAGSAYVVLECRCDLPSVAHAPFLPPSDPKASLVKQAKTPEEWAALTRQDLMEVRRQLERNTPIPYDTENPAYGRWLLKGYEEALQRAAQVDSFSGYYFTLAAYMNGFRDLHLAFGLVGEPPPGRWPGFIVSLEGDHAEIVFRDEADAAVPALGSKVISCDGKSVRELAREKIFPFRHIEVIPSHVRLAVSRLFLDRFNPFAPAIQSCEIETAGTRQTLALQWRALPADEDKWFEHFSEASNGPGTEWGVREVEPGVWWIGVPTFSSGDDTAPLLKTLMEEVEKKGAQMREARAIVIDTRGNGGGNSAWADRLAKAAFTPEVLAKHPAPERSTATDWRASKENGVYWYEWAVQMEKEFGAWSFNRLSVLFLGRQLTKFAESDPPLYRIPTCWPSKSGGLTKMRPTGESPFRAKVYVLSNGSCGSSCLNFADTVLMVPGVKLIGAATSADGVYMDVRSVDLPSGLGSVTFAQKVERGGGRAALEYYEADVAYDGAWSDAAVRAWVMGVVKQ